ncbi:MAG: GAF domain-containing sensor histidine kinase [Aquabacterium sp.]|nr:GAF domain-containing sensor histidine kinase [Aquabacterium sp.]
MLPAPIPEDDERRLDALRRYCVLDTQAEPAFDHLALVAQHLMKVPTVLVSLVDADRQWFKARLGLDATETPRDISFCGHAVYVRDMLVVPDATQDERFADNPLVTGELGLRFYAGAPLITSDGQALGTLCAIDYEPRSMPTEADLTALRHLADAVVAALELRRHGLLQERQLSQTRALSRLAASVNRAPDVNAALACLGDWCEAWSMDAGQAYFALDGPSDQSELSRIWEVAAGPGLVLAPDGKAAERTELPDEAFQTALATREPVLIEDLAGVPGARMQAARDAGVRSVLLLPVSAAQRVLCLIECHLRAPVDDAVDLRAAAAYVSLQLNLLAERGRLERAKDDFVTTVSHELRTPLTSIVGALELLKDGRGGVLPPKATNMVHIAQRNGERLARLVNDILDLGKLEARRMLLQTSVQPLAPLIERVVAENTAFAEGLHVSLAFKTAHPQACANVDEDKFIQVVTNLLSNAVKFSPAGGVVNLGLAPHDGGWRLSVSDQGPGIPLAFQGRVFEKFAQASDGASSNVNKREGSGLGLAIVQHIVRLHGARVSFESVEGQGTTFHVDFPPGQGGERGVG